MSAAAPWTVISSDGTPLAVWTTGDGPPLVMVHGGMADHTTFALLAPMLERQFTVHSIDRRGRHASGDAEHYDVELEFDEIAAVVDAVAGGSGTAVVLYGHSYGATCALGGATRTDNVRALAIYEPGLRGVFDYPDGFFDQLRELIADGLAEEALVLGLTTRAGASNTQLDAMRAAPSWSARVAAVSALTRELQVDATLAFDPARLEKLVTPTTLLLGELSPRGQRTVVKQIAATLPLARVVELPGQEHMAQVSAPELVANAVASAAGLIAPSPPGERAD